MRTLEEFLTERNAALLSLDEGRIRAMVKKFNGTDLPTNHLVFWGSVHKAITGATDLPIEFRRKSKAWLTARGYGSHDDGDLDGEWAVGETASGEEKETNVRVSDCAEKEQRHAE